MAGGRPKGSANKIKFGLGNGKPINQRDEQFQTRVSKGFNDAFKVVREENPRQSKSDILNDMLIQYLLYRTRRIKVEDIHKLIEKI